MTFQWGEFLETARFLHIQGKTNSTPQEAAYRSSISRAYYAAFCHSRCYASARLQYIPLGNEKDHKILRVHLTRHGMQKESQTLDRLRQWRNHCDYDNPTATATEITVQTAITQADLIISSLHLP
jgi:uncharacterized protein (UPF0332 family)